MRCNNAELFKLISNDKIKENDEIELRIKRKLADCRRISTLKPVQASADATADQYNKPANKFECKRTGCVNTGTLSMALANDYAVYQAMYDGTEFTAGVVTFYVEAPTTPVTVTFSIGDDVALTDANVYEKEITADMVGADGFAPVVILLSDPPTSVEGNGWTPSAAGQNFIKLTATEVAGYSSISIQNALSSFELYDIIKMRCVQSAGDDTTLSVIEEQCQAVQYDQNVNTMPFSVTSSLVSSNYLKANPMYGKGENVKGFQIANVKKTVEAYTVGTKNYGKITIADANQNECARIAVQAGDDCESSMLLALSVPTLIDVDAAHFLVIDNADGSTDIILNEQHVGSALLVSYPQTAEVNESVFSTDFLGDAEASIVWTKHTSDGKTYVDVFDNVFVTSFPRTISNTTATFAWQFSVARDADGNFYRTQEILA